jgi:hypothetical protein
MGQPAPVSSCTMGVRRILAVALVVALLFRWEQTAVSSPT